MAKFILFLQANAAPLAFLPHISYNSGQSIWEDAGYEHHFYRHRRRHRQRQDHSRGKTTLTEHLAARFGSDISVVHHDNYYKRQDRPFAERCQQNYDHPDAFDTDLMIADLKALKRGETIHCPVYDYSIHNRTDETVEVRPTKVVIVEGILIFQNKALRDLLDIKIFVETDADVRILRRALRDVEERGRSLESVVNQYLTTVKPMHEQFVEPTRKFADIIVLEGGHNLVALDMIMQRIASHIRES